ncbi:hypothetical protein KKF61_08145 [Patescibacteria group bacterium]|nr:hypothetical protein [Patescibacteria group bacterium]
MAVFGNTNLESAGNAQIDYGSETDTGEYIAGAQFTAPASGTVTSITVYLRFVAGSRQGPHFSVKCAIYERDAVSETHDLVGVTEERHFTWAVSAIDGWFTFNIVSGTGAIVSGTDYILAAWGEVEAGTGSTSGLYIKYTVAGASDYYYVATPYTGTYPDPWTAADLADFDVSIYATYTPSGGGAVPQRTLTGVGV